MKRQHLSIFLVIGLALTLIVVIVAGEIKDQRQQVAVKAIAQKYNQELAKQTEEAKAKQEEEIKREKVKGVGHTIHYVAIGDSLTAGWYASSPDKAYVNLISSKLQNKMGFNMLTSLHGQPGAVLSWGLDQINKVNSEKPDLITIEFGTNDVASNYLTDPRVFEAELNTMIDDLTIKVDRSPVIVLVTTWSGNTVGDQYDAIIEKVGKERHIPIANISYAKRDPSAHGPDGRATYLGKGDAYHPNDNGMQQISDVIYEQIKPLVIQLVDNKKI